MNYVIKKGNHRSNYTLDRLQPFCDSNETGTFRFDTACLMKEEIPGWNKLTGISNILIHRNSARLVWRSNGTRINIAGYVYKDGVRKEKEICMVRTNEDIEYSIDYNTYTKTVQFQVNEQTIIMDANLDGLKFKCYPFFGGQSTAGTRMKINIIKD